VSAGRRIPTLNEFRSFGRGKSVPFDTLAFALDHQHEMCGIGLIGLAPEFGGLQGRAALMFRWAGCYLPWSDGTHLWHTW